MVAGLLWWLIPSSGSDRIDALAIMEDACRQAEAVDSVDITVRGTNTLGDATLKVVEEYRVNGRDWHKAVYDDQGNLLAEVFLVDYHSYAREINEEGQWGEWEISAPPQVLLEALESNSEPGSDVGPTGQVDGSDVGPTGQVDDPPGGAETFCGLWDLLDVTYLGEGMVGDTDVKHFAVEVNEDLPGEDDSYEKWEYWIDSNGRILQIKDEVFKPDDYGPSQRVEATTTYHGFGEPNVITAPEIP